MGPSSLQIRTKPGDQFTDRKAVSGGLDGNSGKTKWASPGGGDYEVDVAAAKGWACVVVLPSGHSSDDGPGKAASIGGGVFCLPVRSEKREWH